MTPIDRILVAVDFSECSAAAADYAAFMARELKAELDVLHVWQPPHELGPLLGQLAITDPSDKREITLSEFICSQAKAALDKQLEGLRDKHHDVEATGRLEEGPVKQTIVEVAASGNYDLVVMGTHGRTGLDHLLTGSVAEWVVRHSPVAVITVGAHSRTRQASTSQAAS